MPYDWLDLKHKINLCEQQSHRASGSVKLLAASKGQSLEKIKALYDQGQRIFGENYLQEALIKIPSLPADIEWHFIGPIQSNKTKKIAEHFSWVQSVDSERVAKRLNDQRPSSLPPLNICIEVNINNEISKSGITSDAVISLAKACQQLPNLRLRGLMAIPAPQDNPSQLKQSFHQLFTLYHTLQQTFDNIDTLSMGMSHDFELAISEGSTMVRVGSALFGER
jgi:pyridoxal phosphate enzyme (YggS family)